MRPHRHMCVRGPGQGPGTARKDRGALIAFGAEAAPPGLVALRLCRSDEPLCGQACELDAGDLRRLARLASREAARLDREAKVTP